MKCYCEQSNRTVQIDCWKWFKQIASWHVFFAPYTARDIITNMSFNISKRWHSYGTDVFQFLYHLSLCNAYFVQNIKYTCRLEFKRLHHVFIQDKVANIVSQAFTVGVASNAGYADSSRAPGLTSGLQGSVNVHRGSLLLVLQWQCISSFVFYIYIYAILLPNFLCVPPLAIEIYILVIRYRNGTRTK